MSEDLQAFVEAAPSNVVTVVSGAGLSAASGIPTFRGPQGYWTVGAKEYRPQELATLAAFQRMPKEIWHWYLYRRGICRAAAPNAAHHALAELEADRQDAFALLSQNVDGLHVRAGNSLERTYEVHGNIDLMRCAAGCTTRRVQIPEDLCAWPKDQALDEATFARLHCPDCKGPARPHILWFDEYYQEALYRAQSALRQAARSELIVFVGCSGAANLPWSAAEAATQNGARLVNIDPSPNPFSEMAEAGSGNLWLRGPADEWLPRLVAALVA